jgi:hypothetical protein
MEQEETQVIGNVGNSSVPMIVWIPVNEIVSRSSDHRLWQTCLLADVRCVALAQENVVKESGR